MKAKRHDQTLGGTAGKSVLGRVDWFLIGGIAFLFILSGMTQMDFSLPRSFYGDRIGMMLGVKELLQHGNIFTNHSIGFPAYFNTLGFMTLGFTQSILIFISTLFSNNIIGICNIYYIFVIILNYSSAYFVCRSFTADKTISCFVGLLFVFTPYFFFRSSVHDGLAGYYGVPLAFLLARRLEALADLPSLRAALKRYFGVTTCCILLVVAYSGVYYTAFTLMLLAFMGLIMGVQRKSWKIFATAAAACAIIFVLVLLALWPSQAYVASLGSHLARRNYWDQATAGMRFSDLIWTASRYFHLPQANGYLQWRGLVEGYDFWPGLPLSLAFLGFLFFHYCIRDGVRTFCGDAANFRTRPDTIRALLAFSVFCLFFSMVYGLGFLFNFFFTPAIRAQGRISSFFEYSLLLACACILASAGRVRRLREKRLGRFLFGGALLAFFLLNSYPWVNCFARQQRDFLASRKYQAEMQSLHGMLGSVHAYSCRRVLQLPITFWPEAPERGTFAAYDHFLPYIFDDVKSDTTWSYGLMKKDPAYQVQQILQRLPAPSFVAYARYLGFDSVLVEKRAYSAGEVKAMQADFSAAGCRLVARDGLRQLYLLPAAPARKQGDPFPFAGQWLGIAADSGWQAMLRTGWNVLRSGAAVPLGSHQTFVLPLRITPAHGAGIEMELGLPPGFVGTLRTVVSCNGNRLAVWKLSSDAGSEVRRLDLTAGQTAGWPFPIVTFRSTIAGGSLRAARIPKDFIPGLLLRRIRLSTLRFE